MAITTKEEGVWGVNEVYNKINHGSIWEYDSNVRNLYSWGVNCTGSLGLNQAHGIKISSPTQIPGDWGEGSNFTGRGCEFIIRKGDGTLWVWGQNDKGQLGKRNLTKYSSPVQIYGGGTTWSSTGSSFYNANAAIKEDGTLWIMGDDANGQLGQENNIRYSSPTQIPGTSWKSIDGGDGWFLATRTDGTLWAWGQNTEGQLGHNNKTQYSSPVQIHGAGTTWKQFSGGIYNQCFATKTDGTLWSWGYNPIGGLGHNNKTKYSSPKQVGSDTTWSIVSQSYYQSVLATKTDGTLWGWGNNHFGNLGLNNRTNYSSPVQVPGTTWGTTINDLAGTDYGGFARKTDGTIWAWGVNDKGQLGQNEGPGSLPSGSYSSPVQIPGTWDVIHTLAGKSLIAYKNV